MDYSLYKTINGLSGNSFPDGLLKLLANDLPTLLVALVALVFLVAWRERRHERRAGAVLGTAAAALSLLINQPIAHAVERLRPYVVHPAHAHLLISRSHDRPSPASTPPAPSRWRSESGSMTAPSARSCWPGPCSPLPVCMSGRTTPATSWPGP